MVGTQFWNQLEGDRFTTPYGEQALGCRLQAAGSSQAALRAVAHPPRPLLPPAKTPGGEGEPSGKFEEGI